MRSCIYILNVLFIRKKYNKTVPFYTVLSIELFNPTLIFISLIYNISLRTICCFTDIDCIIRQPVNSDKKNRLVMPSD